jgi:hypothetical protein
VGIFTGLGEEIVENSLSFDFMEAAVIFVPFSLFSVSFFLFSFSLSSFA